VAKAEHHTAIQMGIGWQNVGQGGWHPESRLVVTGRDYVATAGDVQPYGNHSIKMSESAFDDGRAWYEFYLGENYVKEGMKVGIFFCDKSAVPFNGGPNLSIYNWPSATWDRWWQLGEQDIPQWVWKTTSNSNNYVKPNVWRDSVEVWAEWIDYTILDSVGVRFCGADEEVDECHLYLIDQLWDDDKPDGCKFEVDVDAGDYGDGTTVNVLGKAWLVYVPTQDTVDADSGWWTITDWEDEIAPFPLSAAGHNSGEYKFYFQLYDEAGNLEADMYTPDPFYLYPEQPAAIELYPEEKRFGVVKIGKCSSEQVFYLTSVGTATATGTVSITGEFRITKGGGEFTLGPGDEREIGVEFCPEGWGFRYGTLLADGANCYNRSSSLRGWGSFLCFLAGTRIAMADGSYKNIENIKVGDMVKSYDVTNKRLERARVTKLYHHSKDEMSDYYLIINKSLGVTPNHPLHINGRWGHAEDAKVGDLLFGMDGSNVSITSIEKVFQQTPTYNLEIEGQETYFVNGVLALQKIAAVSMEAVTTEQSNAYTLMSGRTSTEEVTTDHTAESDPKSFALSQNFPNPFNPESEISYDLPNDSWVKLSIYNISGQKVKTLVDGFEAAGHKTVIWDGKNEKGEQVASGVYFYRLEAGDFTATKKMVLLR